MKESAHADTCPDDLRKVIEEQFLLETVLIESNGKTFEFLQCSDVDQVFQFSNQLKGTLAQPYWGQIWESAIGMCRLLERIDLDDKTVLDLGCGVGIAGAFAASCGANTVLVDAIPEAVKLATLNSWRWRKRARCKRVDWHSESLDQRFDYILGGDIVYDRNDWNALSEFWKHHLEPSGKVLLVEPVRRTGYEFANWITKRWRIESSKLDPENDVPLQQMTLSLNF